MAIQDDSLILLRVISEATAGSSVPILLEELPDLQMDVEQAKAAFRYLESKGLIETFSLAYSARLSAAGRDFLTDRVSRHAAPPLPQTANVSEQGEIIMLKPNLWGIGLDLNALFRRFGWRGGVSTPSRALVLLPDESQSFAHHAPQQDGRKLTQIAVRGWATNTTDTALYPTLVRLSRPFGAKATSNFIITQGAGDMFSSENPVLPGARRKLSAHFFLKGFVGKPGRPLRVVIKVCDNFGRWHRWVFPALPNR